MEKDCEKKIEELKKEIRQLEEACKKRKFKTGDWVCFNHGEYPEYFTKEPWQITHWSFEYNKKTGAPMGRIHKSAGMAHDETCLRYAHLEEIEYFKAGLPHIYNKEKEEYERVEIDGENFKIGDTFDTKDLSNLTGKSLITFLLENRFLNESSNMSFSEIYEKLK